MKVKENKDELNIQGLSGEKHETDVTTFGIKTIKLDILVE